MRGNSVMGGVLASMLSTLPTPVASAGDTCGMPTFPGDRIDLEQHYPGRPVLGDLDGDGDIDLVVAGSAVVLTLLNAGDGTFSVAQEIGSVSMGFTPMTPALGDLDQDGDLDLAYTTAFVIGGGLVVVCLNDGRGEFTSMASYSPGTGTALVYEQHAVICKVDADADNDLLIRVPTGVRVMTNNGTGTMTLGAFYPLAGYTSELSAASDLDDDGDQDVAIGVGPAVYIVRNQSGVLVPEPLITLAATVRDVTIINLDDDLDPDIVASLDDPARVMTLINDDGVFAISSDIGIDDTVSGVASADQDGDGDVDLIAGFSPGSIVTLINEGRGVFVSKETRKVVDAIEGPVAADLDGDGDSDLAATDILARAVVVLENDGTGKYDHVVLHPDDSELQTTRIIARDFDGDKRMDVAVSLADYSGVSYPEPGGCALYFGEVGGTFEPAVVYSLAGHTDAIGAADMDGDGDEDLILASYVSPGPQNLIQVLANDGKGSFTTLSTLISPLFLSFSEEIQTGDLDLDGDLDVVGFMLYEPTLQLLMNDGDGNLTLVAEPIGSLPVRDVTVGDFNGDDKEDLIVCTGNGGPSSGTHFVLVRLNDGKGSFDTVVQIPGFFLEDAVIGDINGDELMDLVVGAGIPKLFFNDGLGGLASQPPPDLDLLPADRFDLGDADDDGDLDLVLELQHGGIALVLNDGFGNFTVLADRGTTGNGTSHPIMGDADNDGDLDILVSTILGLNVFPNRACEEAANPVDLDGDGHVDGFDLALLLGQWGPCAPVGVCSADLDGNGVVNGMDLAVLLGAWG